MIPAQALQVIYIQGSAAFLDRHYMVYNRCKRYLAFSFAMLTQGIDGKLLLSKPLPLGGVIEPLAEFVSFKAVIFFIFLFLVPVAILSVCQIRATWIAAWAFRLSWHQASPAYPFL